MEIKIKSTLDNTEQLSLFYKAEGEEKRPLFVGLHRKYASLCPKI